MNSEQTTPANVNVPAKKPSEKQVWETPELRVLELEDTEGGGGFGPFQDGDFVGES